MSYTFGLTGPCVSTDTACSSSLVAGHLAHRGLLNGEATSAVAAGVNLMLSSLTTIAICQLQVGAPACNIPTAQEETPAQLHTVPGLRLLLCLNPQSPRACH